MVENAVGAHLLQGLTGPTWNVTYWRNKQLEVDFVVSSGSKLWAIEVKSGSIATNFSGLSAFKQRYPSAQLIVIGPGGISLPEFFSAKPETLLAEHQSAKS